MERTVYFTALFLTLFAAAYGGIIAVQDCEGIENRATDIIVDVSDCETGTNCTLVKGNTYHLKTKFTLLEDIQRLNMRTLGVMGRVKMPYMGHRAVCPEAITEDGVNCDSTVGLLAGVQYTHVKEFPVRNTYPEMAMKARVEYFTGSRPTAGNTIICFEVPVQIVKAEDNEV
ncbi:hypothetical protein X975_07136, partial [Stegodyphus mimosarum]